MMELLLVVDTASSSLNTNIFPFILRGVRLIGIDSVECSLDKKNKMLGKN